jgi:hypothetical protein
MKLFLLSLLPWTKKEWSDFITDLSPLLGLFLFSTQPRYIMLPLYPELYLLFAFGLIRLTSTAIYMSIQQVKEMGLGNLNVPESIFGKIFYFIFMLFFGSILIVSLICIILILIGFNFFFYLLIELFLSVACSGGMEANFNFLQLYNSLSNKEQYYVWGIFLFTLYRYLPKIIHFFKNKQYKNTEKSWAWLAMGSQPIPKRNQFQSMFDSKTALSGSGKKLFDLWDSLGIIYVAFLFLYFGSIVLMVYLPLAGPIITLFIKAFAEMNYFRLYNEIESKA